MKVGSMSLTVTLSESTEHAKQWKGSNICQLFMIQIMFLSGGFGVDMMWYLIPHDLPTLKSNHHQSTTKY